MKKAMFGAGCFWGVEKKFYNLKGVMQTTVGYAGGHKEDPTYNEVCQDTTGHAEVVYLEYDPEVITYEDLLDFFFGMHNPTTLNRQGPDIGSQYRSIVFYTTAEEKKIIEKEVESLNASSKFLSPIVTEVASWQKFYKAEAYHQKYLF
jgi:peptide-methionine (S)-S-oxide reductase